MGLLRYILMSMLVVGTLQAAGIEDGAIAEKAGRYREAFDLYLSSFQAEPPGSAERDKLRERIIGVATRMKPPPIAPEMAERHLARGEAAIERAKSTADFEIAVREFELAASAAPWHADAYFNLGVALEKIEKAKDAMKNFRLYLLAAPNAPDAASVKKRLYKLEYEIEAVAIESAKKVSEAQRLESMAGYWRTYTWHPARYAGASDYDFTRENDKPTFSDPGWSHTLSPMRDETAFLRISGSRFEADFNYFSRDQGRFVGEIRGSSVRGKMNYIVRREHDAVCPGHIAEFPFEGVIDPDAGKIMLLVRGDVTAQVVGKCYSVVENWGSISRMLLR